jgi:hypothetical protein
MVSPPTLENLMLNSGSQYFGACRDMTPAETDALITLTGVERRYIMRIKLPYVR